MKNIFQILIFAILFFSIQSCKKDKPVLPTVETIDVTGIYSTSAQSGGAVTNEGSDSVVSRGVCWDIATKPTITKSITINGRGLGVYTSNILSLIPNTTYYLRAYALSNAGIGYGHEVSFTTSGVPSLNTSDISSITYNSAESGGTITSEHGQPVTEKGVCWSTFSNPTILNNKTVDGNGTASFNSSITGLQQATTYYVRSYATNIIGTGYGDVKTFKTAEITSTDIDGNVYKAINIGAQIWFNTNLKTTRYNDGSSIPNVTDNLQWTNLTTGALCWYNNDEGTFKATYGTLYNWYAAATGILCPVGWHVPSDAEWTTMTDFLGGLSVAGGMMKEVGITHWNSPNTGATNESGFTSLGAGNRHSDGPFSDLGIGSGWWTSTASTDQRPWYYSNWYTNAMAGRYNGALNTLGLYIRCIKD